MRREVYELYGSSAIADFAIAMILLFEPIFFVAVLGWDLSRVLLFFAGVYALYILFIPFGASVASRRGYEHAMLYSIPFQIAYWLLLFNAADHAWAIPLAIVAFAIEKSLFWPAFHADLARFSDPDQRGREFSGIYALIHLVHIVGPFVGGLISNEFGVRALLVVASATYFMMFVPLFTTPERLKPKGYKFKETLSLYKNYPREAVAHIGFGEELLVLVAWPIFIYQFVPNFFNLGSVIAVSTLIATLVTLYAGKAWDRGRRKQVLGLGVILSMVVWFLRPLVKTLFGVVWADTGSRISRDMFIVSLTSNVYDRANDHRILPYVVFFEQSLSIGKLLAAILGSLLFALTGSFVVIFILAAVFTSLYLFLPLKPKLIFQDTQISSQSTLPAAQSTIQKP